MAAALTEAPVFLGYQQRWAADESEVKICEKSRRVGLSWCEAGVSVLKAAAQRNARDTWYIGYSKDMAEEFVKDAAMWATALDEACSAIEEGVLDDEGRDIKTFRVTFATGKRITALSSRPKNLRGKKGRVVIDEAAFHDNLGELIKAALALLMWGAQVSIISTHDGVDNPFNELIGLVRAGKKPYSLHRITLDDALEDGLYRRICMTKDPPERWTPEGEDEWRERLIAFYGEDADEELFCIPRNSGGPYFSRALVESRMVDAPVVRKEFPAAFGFKHEFERVQEVQEWLEATLNPLLEGLQPDHFHYFGMDFGRTGDLSVLTPLAQARDLSCRVPFLLELRNAPHETQKQILFYVVDRLPRMISGAMDAGGNGSFLAEVAAQRYGEDVVEQLKLSEMWHREAWPKYKAALEDATLALPRDADLLEDHRAVVVENGVPKVARTRTRGHQDRKQRHGDGAMACCLAWYARGRDVAPVAYESVGPRQDPGALDDFMGDW